MGIEWLVQVCQHTPNAARRAITDDENFIHVIAAQEHGLRDVNETGKFVEKRQHPSDLGFTRPPLNLTHFSSSKNSHNINLDFRLQAILGPVSWGLRLRRGRNQARQLRLGLSSLNGLTGNPFYNFNLISRQPVKLIYERVNLVVKACAFAFVKFLVCVGLCR